MTWPVADVVLRRTIVLYIYDLQGLQQKSQALVKRRLAATVRLCRLCAGAIRPAPERGYENAVSVSYQSL